MAKTPDPATPQPSFRDGLDSLWKFQLRKENAVLLENQEAQQKILQALVAESSKVGKDFEAHFSVLEARLCNLENEQKKNRHTFETWLEELAALKSQMGVHDGELGATILWRYCSPSLYILMYYS